jgi:hypothetical protein
MLSTKFTIARVSALICAAFGFGQAAAVRDSAIAGPTGVATKADVSFCFARVRGLDPERLPPAYLALRLRVTVSYQNAGTRPVILPLERKRTIFIALEPGQMRVFKEGLFDPSLKVMTTLPNGVSQDSPVSPKNDAFAVIPPGGEMTPPLVEEVMMPVSSKGVFRRSPDLRGHRVYLKLRFEHRELSAALRADLSDRWSRFGVPWTGTLTTNTILIDVPPAPEAEPCKDSYVPAHPVVGDDDKK